MNCARVEIRFRGWLFWPLFYLVALPMLYLGANETHVADALLRTCLRLRLRR